MANHTSRRYFLRTAPVAAAVGLTLIDRPTFAAPAGQAAAAGAAPVAFQAFTAKQLEDEEKALQAKQGNNNLVDATPGMPCAVVLTTEIGKSAKEFEWHDGRDHLVQIVDGTTLYEVGGTPKDGRNTKPGEYLAADSVGATKVMMKKGDMLTIPRGTPHRRSTEGSVTFLLISSYGVMKA